MEVRSIEYHYEHGLPKTINSKAVISIVMGKNTKQNNHIKYWTFELKKDLKL